MLHTSKSTPSTTYRRSVMKVKWAAILGALLCMSMSLAVGQDSNTPEKKSAGTDVEDATKTVVKKTGHATKVAAEDTGKGAKVVAKDTAKGTEVVAKDTGKAAEKTGTTVKKGVTGVGHEVKKGTEKPADPTPADPAK